MPAPKRSHVWSSSLVTQLVSEFFVGILSPIIRKTSQELQMLTQITCFSIVYCQKCQKFHKVSQVALDNNDFKVMSIVS